MVSHLDRYRGKKLFSRREWKQSLFVLTNIGILQFEEIDDKKPSGLIPVCNSDLRELAKSEYQRDFTFAVKTFSEEIVFAAFSKGDYDAWIDAIQQLQLETERKQRHISEKQNIQELMGSFISTNSVVPTKQGAVSGQRQTGAFKK